MNNLLLNTYTTPYKAFPFDQVKQEDYQPAIMALLESAQAEVNAIATNEASPTFDNVIAALDRSGELLSRVTEAFFNIDSAETNDYIQDVAQQLAPELAAYSNDILMNNQLFEKVKSVHANEAGNVWSEEAQMLLDKTYKSFVRNGALLSEADKERLRYLDQQLSGLKVKFSQNVLQETNAYQLHLKTKEDVAGLPESLLDLARSAAEAAGLDGYVITLHYPSYVPFMKYADNRAHRETLYKAYLTRGSKENAYNNESVIKKLVQYKDERAQLLGYDSHSDFVLEERMAESPAQVRTFLEDLLIKAKPYAVKEIAALEAMAKQDGISEMQSFDHAYYSEKLREQQYDYSEEAMKPYFPLEQVLNAAFNLSDRLFGLTFEKINDVPTYHEEVSVYKVKEGDTYKALLYTDFHPRPGKRAGAWMTSFKGQHIIDGENERPHISIVCNFSRGTSDQPSLLTFQEVTTLFHEFGHALHGMLADTTFESLSGTNVYWDFVELPSQFLENYCYEKEFLLTFAHHWKTQELLAEQEIDKIIAARSFMEGYQTMRQLSFGLLDLAYYSGANLSNKTIATFEREQIAPTQLYPVIADTCFSTSFSHIFGGGYDSGYYSYKWAEVLDADAFGYFRETGIFNPTTAASFHTLLSKGGTVDPMHLYATFRGRAPQVDALLERAGLVLNIE